MLRSNQHQYLAQLTLLVVAIIWGAAFVAQRTAMQHLGPFAFNGLRFLLGAAVLGAILFFTRRLQKVTRQDIYLGALLGLALFVAASLQQVGVVTTSAGKAGFITGLYIVLIPFFLWLFARRQTGSRVWLGIVAAVVGLFLLSVGTDFSLAIGDIWVLLCAAAFAVHMIMTERLVRDHDPWILAEMQFIFMAVASLVVAGFREPFTTADVQAAWIEILYAGVLSAGFGYTAQAVAQKYTSAVTAGIICSLESVFAALAGWVFLSETFTDRQKVGCMLMFLGTILAQLPGGARSRVPKEI